MVAGVDARVLRVGCPMWAHPSWVDRFVSSPVKGRQLAEYASWCNAVEGNTTFYAVPSSETVERWQSLAPPEFRFAFKVPKVVTHDRRLRHADAELADFLSALEPLGERIGPMQIQLPPSFGPESLPQLDSFVRRLPAGFEWVAELRHPALFDRSDAHRRVDEILRAANIGRVVLDTRPLYAEPAATPAAAEERRSKPRLPVRLEAVGDNPVVRLIGASSREATLAGLLAWVPQVVDWLASGLRPYVFVHQPENRDSPLLARRATTTPWCSRPTDRNGSTTDQRTTSTPPTPISPPALGERSRQASRRSRVTATRADSAAACTEPQSSPSV